MSLATSTRRILGSCTVAALVLTGCGNGRHSSTSSEPSGGSSALVLARPDIEMLAARTDAMWVTDSSGCIILTADPSTGAGELAVWPSGTTLTTSGEVLLPDGQELSQGTFYRFGGGGIVGDSKDIDRDAMSTAALDCLAAYGGGWLVSGVKACVSPDCPDADTPQGSESGP